MPVVARTVCVLLLAILPTGCGRDVTVLDEIAGSEVGTMAEHELEVENPRLAPGTLVCPDLEFRVGASVRCVRTATLPNGRVVKVGGTVRVSSLESGGRLHVTMDDHATEFGVSGEQVASSLRRQYEQLFGRAPDGVRCPYLPGKVGARVTCRVQAGDKRKAVDAVVGQVNAEEYDVRYTFRPHKPS